MLTYLLGPFLALLPRRWRNVLALRRGRAVAQSYGPQWICRGGDRGLPPCCFGIRIT